MDHFDLGLLLVELSAAWFGLLGIAWLLERGGQG